MASLTTEYPAPGEKVLDHDDARRKLDFFSKKILCLITNSLGMQKKFFMFASAFKNL